MTKEEIQKLIEETGQTRGQTLLTDFQYIKYKMGQEGANRLSEKIKEWQAPFSYEGVKVMDWYPVGWRALSLLAMEEIFSWSDQNIFEVGNSAPKYSVIVKLLMKYFLTPKKTFQESSKYWQKHYTVGEMDCPEFDEEKREGIVCIKDFKIHPILCTYYKGYFLRICQYVLPGDSIRIEETECPFSGGKLHEFKINW